MELSVGSTAERPFRFRALDDRPPDSVAIGTLRRIAERTRPRKLENLTYLEAFQQLPGSLAALRFPTTVPTKSPGPRIGLASEVHT